MGPTGGGGATTLLRTVGVDGPARALEAALAASVMIVELADAPGYMLVGATGCAVALVADETPVALSPLRRAIFPSILLASESAWA
jgi:hypothetical protein